MPLALPCLKGDEGECLLLTLVFFQSFLVQAVSYRLLDLVCQFSQHDFCLAGNVCLT